MGTCSIEINENNFPILETLVLIDQPQITINHDKLRSLIMLYCRDTKPLEIIQASGLHEVHVYGCSGPVLSEVACNAGLSIKHLTKGQVLGIIDRYNLGYIAHVGELL